MIQPGKDLTKAIITYVHSFGSYDVRVPGYTTEMKQIPNATKFKFKVDDIVKLGYQDADKQKPFIFGYSAGVGGHTTVLLNYTNPYPWQQRYHDAFLSGRADTTFPAVAVGDFTWQTNIVSATISNIVIATVDSEDVIMFTSGDTAYAYKGSDGSLLWETDLGAGYTNVNVMLALKRLIIYRRKTVAGQYSLRLDYLNIDDGIKQKTEETTVIGRAKTGLVNHDYAIKQGYSSDVVLPFSDNTGVYSYLLIKGIIASLNDKIYSEKRSGGIRSLLYKNDIISPGWVVYPYNVRTERVKSKYSPSGVEVTFDYIMVGNVADNQIPVPRQVGESSNVQTRTILSDLGTFRTLNPVYANHIDWPFGGFGSAGDNLFIPDFSSIPPAPAWGRRKTFFRKENLYTINRGGNTVTEQNFPRDEASYILNIINLFAFEDEDENFYSFENMTMAGPHSGDTNGFSDYINSDSRTGWQAYCNNLKIFDFIPPPGVNYSIDFLFILESDDKPFICGIKKEDVGPNIKWTIFKVSHGGIETDIATWNNTSILFTPSRIKCICDPDGNMIFNIKDELDNTIYRCFDKDGVVLWSKTNALILDEIISGNDGIYGIRGATKKLYKL